MILPLVLLNYLQYPTNATFLTLDGEIGLVLHEMWQISRLSIGDIPYKEHFPRLKELETLFSLVSSLYHTLWNMTCYFLYMVRFA